MLGSETGNCNSTGPTAALLAQMCETEHESHRLGTKCLFNFIAACFFYDIQFPSEWYRREK